MVFPSLRVCHYAYPVAVLLALVFFFGPSPARAAGAPTELVGIRLGETVAQAGNKLRPGPPDLECHRSGMTMMPVAPMVGYRSGYVDVGQCAYPGRIARIKMHYDDDSLAFFNTILAALKKRYGNPSEWRGNAFGTLRTWKWGLTASDGTSVSLILMYYAGDDGAFTQGNSIRLAASKLVHAEVQCQKDRYPQVPAEWPHSLQSHQKHPPLEWFLPHASTGHSDIP